jgi:hypothetical protein
MRALRDTRAGFIRLGCLQQFTQQYYISSTPYVLPPMVLYTVYTSLPIMILDRPFLDKDRYPAIEQIHTS